MLHNLTRWKGIQWKLLVLLGIGAFANDSDVSAQGFVWTKQVGLTGSMLPPPPYNLPTVPSKIAVDNTGNVYITGSFLGTAKFGSTNLTSVGDADLFLAKYNDSGDLQWAWQAGGVGRDHSADVAVDLAGNIYITGTFSETATFGSTNLTTAGGNVFIAKLNSSGTLIWVRGGLSGGEGFGIAVDSAGNTYCTGNVGPAILIEKRDPLGNILWHKELPRRTQFQLP
jgi:hypothetical protein